MKAGPLPLHQMCQLHHPLKIINRANLIFFRLLWDIVVFRMVAHLLNIICLKLGDQILYTKSHVYEFWYNFDAVLYQFLGTGTSDRNLIGLDQLLKFLGFSIYPILFFLYSPFNLKIDLKSSLKNYFSVYF